MKNLNTHTASTYKRNRRAVLVLLLTGLALKVNAQPLTINAVNDSQKAHICTNKLSLQIAEKINNHINKKMEQISKDFIQRITHRNEHKK